MLMSTMSETLIFFLRWINSTHNYIPIFLNIYAASISLIVHLLWCELTDVGGIFLSTIPLHKIFLADAVNLYFVNSCARMWRKHVTQEFHSISVCFCCCCRKRSSGVQKFQWMCREIRVCIKRQMAASQQR